MTVKQVKEFCKQNNINFNRMRIYKHGGRICIEMADIPPDLIKKNLENKSQYGNIPEIDRLIRRYNRQANRLVSMMKTDDGWSGYKSGTGEWFYRSGGFTTSERLAGMNID